MVKPRILTSSKDCLDVEAFSSFDRFISHMGYPSEEIISDIEVVDEFLNMHLLYIQNEEVHCTSSKLDAENVKKIADRVVQYIKIVGGYDLATGKREICHLIDEIIKIRGLTY